MPAAGKTLFGSDLWRPTLEKFSDVTHLTVELYGIEERVPWGPVQPTPLFGIFEEHAWDPRLFAECARRCLAQAGGARPAVTVAQAHGLAVVGTSLVLGGEIVGAAVGGYVFVDFPNAPRLKRLAREAGVPFQRLWEVARRQPPVPERRLALHGELLQVLGDALLRENERTRQYEDAVERLEIASAAKDEFLAVLSHELRTPLTPIVTWSRILRLSGDAADVQRAADVIEQNALLQVRLVEDLLDLNRVTLGKVALDLEIHDLREVLAAARQAISHDADKKGLRLETEAGEPLPVEGDVARLQQVFGNVLSNALKFTPPGGTIHVRAARVDGDAVIRVRDTGEGIAPEFLPFVFDMFRQQEEGTRRKHSGLGIGLALAKRLTERHGGTIAIASPGKGRGTELTVRLPLAAQSPDHATDSSPGTGSRSPFQGLSILVVEDMADTRETVAILLQILGAEVLLACDGREALEMLKEASPHVVLCDLRMPLMDGFEFIRELHRTPDRAELPVIAMSGLISLSDRERTRDAGFEGHVAKPFDEDSLVSAVGAVMGSRRSAHAGPTPGPSGAERRG
ncbi:MAG: ATP-binding protein [Gemmatimonadota bacterium]